MFAAVLCLMLRLLLAVLWFGVIAGSCWVCCVVIGLVHLRGVFGFCAVCGETCAFVVISCITCCSGCGLACFAWCA